MRIALLAVVSIGLAACATTIKEVRVPYEVKVPVDRPVLPPEALTTYQPPATVPQWVPATHPAASSCLTGEGEDVLRANTAREV